MPSIAFWPAQADNQSSAQRASPALAELVYFGNGRTMSVKASRVEGDSVVLTLREGGEATFERSLVARIEEDEVPYPEPVAEA